MFQPPVEYFTRERKFSYAIACFPSFLDPKLKKTPLPKKGIDIPAIKQKLRKKDRIGRGQMLGVFQNPIIQDEEENAYQNYMDDFISRFIINMGINEQIPRDLILVGYLPEPVEDVQELTEQQRGNIKAISGIARTILREIDPISGFGRDMPREPLSREKFKELTQWYVRSSDPLERLAICPVEELPDLYSKDTGAIPIFHQRLYRPKPLSRREFQQLLSEAPGILEKALELKNKYGLTRQEMFQFKGIHHGLQEITGH